LIEISNRTTSYAIITRRFVKSGIHKRSRRLRRQDTMAAGPRIGGVAVDKIYAATDTVAVVSGSRLCRAGEGKRCDHGSDSD
jgi:hypothetical protein